MPKNVTWNKEYVQSESHDTSPLEEYPIDVTFSRPGVTRKTSLIEKLKDAPEWTCVQLEVFFPPNSSSPPHRHGGANVFAFVADGEITSAMNEGEAKVYKKGETWYEAPGCE